MPGSERPFAGALRVVGRLALAAATLWLVGYGLAAPSWTWNLYRVAFDDTVGHRLAGKLAACRTRRGPTVFILGASSAREGFDERRLEQLCPGVSFFNSGLAGGSVDTLAVAALMLRKSGARPTVAVVALHPWMLRAMDQDVVARGYVDFFDLRDGRELLRYQFSGEGHGSALQELRRNTLWPPQRHARQLGRLARAGLARAHGRLYWGERRRASDFEVAREDTRPAPEYRFAEKPGEGLAGMIRRWRRQGYLDPRAYAQPDLAVRLDQVLGSVEQRAGALAVVVMPEHSYLAEHVSPLAEGPFRDALGRAQARGARVFEHARRLPDAAFLDLAHVGPAGREALSRAVAPEIEALLRERGALPAPAAHPQEAAR